MTDTDEGRPMTRHSVFDGEREIRFEGERLGHSSSHRPQKERWIEMALFKTRGGKYIVSGVGMTTIPGETERHWAHVCEAPEGAIESMHLIDRDGVKYLTRTARTTLLQACAADPALRDAYLVETVD